MCILNQASLTTVTLVFPLSESSNTPLLPLHQHKPGVHQESVLPSLQRSNKTGLMISHLVFLYRFLNGIHQRLKISFICLLSGHLWWLLTLCKGYSCQYGAALKSQLDTKNSTRGQHIDVCDLLSQHLILVISPRLRGTLSYTSVSLPVNKHGWILWPGLSPAMCRSSGLCDHHLCNLHNSPNFGSHSTCVRAMSCWSAEKLGVFESACLSMTERETCEWCAGPGMLHYIPHSDTNVFILVTLWPMKPALLRAISSG